MKYAKYGTIVLMLAFLVGFSTPRAMAQQETFKGNFDLQTETYWGPTLLAPGHYTIIIGQDPTERVRLVRLQGEGVRAFILAGPATPEQTSDHSKLRIENINGVSVVRHLDDGIFGQSYVFPVSKNVRMKVERAKATAPTQMTVPVAAGGGD